MVIKAERIIHQVHMFKKHPLLDIVQIRPIFDTAPVLSDNEIIEKLLANYIRRGLADYFRVGRVIFGLEFPRLTFLGVGKNENE